MRVLEGNPPVAPAPTDGGDTRARVAVGRRLRHLLGSPARLAAAFVRPDVRRLERADRVALAILLGVPVLVATIPALVGRPLLDGDNLTQNYPLRVLAGAFLRHGHLPLWNPFIWSGTPLLAGWNAGALYPGTWLFALLPGPAAWTVNLAAIGVVASFGFYAFLRRNGLSAAASFLGAATFADMGFMVGQSVHIGLVQGTSLLPYLLVAIDGMARRAPGTLAVRYVALAGVAAALVVLAGDPRAISNDAIVAGAYALAWCWRAPRRALGLIALLAVAAAFGAGLSAIQWYPGLHFISQSERGAGAYALFAAGSIQVPWILLGLLPYLLGGNGNFGMPVYIGAYNLPELTFAVGLLPILAFLSLPFTRRRVRLPLPVGVWYVLALLGGLLSLGKFSPLGPLFFHVPLFGGERLQNRNVLLTDLALAVLVAVWLDALRGAVPARAPERRDASPARGAGLAERLVGALPALATLGVVAAAFAIPVKLQDFMGVPVPVPSLARQLEPYLLPAAGLAFALGLFALLQHRLRARLLTAVVLVLAAGELALFNLNGSYTPAQPAMIARSNPYSAAVAALTGRGGRYAIYDPLQYYASGTGTAIFDAGYEDLGMLHRLASVQGYGSVVSEDYELQTTTHEVGNLNLTGVSGTTFDLLDLTTLVVPSYYLDQVLPADAAIPVASAKGATLTVVAGTRVLPGEPAARTGPWGLPGGTAQTWFLAAPTSALSVTVALDPTRPAPAALQVGLLRLGGETTWTTAPVAGHDVTVPGLAHHHLVGVTVEPLPGTSAVVGAVAVLGGTPPQRYLLDGPVQGVLAPPHWTFARSIGPLALFTNNAALGTAFVAAPGSTPASPSVLPGSSTSTPAVPPWEEARTYVTTPRATLLVRSTAWAPDWFAVVQTAGSRHAVVERARPFGPVQAVEVPAGRSVVTWEYRPRRVRDALVATAASSLLLVAGLAWFAWRRRKRGTSRGAPSRLGARSPLPLAPGR